MNLSKLFEIQAVLDNRIVEEHNLQGVDLLDEKILALRVELGELANEWRVFKFWKVDPRPRTKIEHLCPYCDKGKVEAYAGASFEETCEDCDGSYVIGETNPLLEEYVDCLHFILSIGLELKCTPVAVDVISKEANLNVTRQFAGLFHLIASVRQDEELHKKDRTNKEKLYNTYHKTFSVFLGLGELLGFTWEQIEQAYYDKNQINHERQENGY